MLCKNDVMHPKIMHQNTEQNEITSYVRQQLNMNCRTEICSVVSAPSNFCFVYKWRSNLRTYVNTLKPQCVTSAIIFRTMDHFRTNFIEFEKVNIVLLYSMSLKWASCMDQFGVMVSRETSKFILLLNSTTDAIKYDNSMRKWTVFFFSFVRSFDSIFSNLIKIHLFRMFSVQFIRDSFFLFLFFSRQFQLAIFFFIKFFYENYYVAKSYRCGCWAL